MAQWIWYPNDFEFYLGEKVMTARTEEGTLIPPGWRLENFCHNVQFQKTITLTEDSYLHFQSTGTICVVLYLVGYLPYDPNKGLFLPKGTHHIQVFVYCKDSLPALYLDHPEVQTGADWEASCDTKNWFPAGYWNFTDPDIPPAKYHLASQPVSYVKKLSVPNGLLYDFGTEYMAKLTFFDVSGSGRILLSYGESKEEALDYNYSTIREALPTTLPEESCKSDSNFSTAQAVAFRYVLVRLEGSVTYRNVEAISEYLPISNRGSFSCEDNLLNKIYETSIHTFHLCSREFFLDGIKRDRWVWSGDATQSYLINFYSFFNNEICKRTMRLLRGKDPVTIHLNTIQDYTLYWFISLGDYYLYTGDLSFIKEIYPSAVSLMEQFCLPQTDERGFLAAKPTDWVFIDWGITKDMIKGDISFIQLLFAQALKILSDMAELTGDIIQQKRYLVLHQNLLSRIFDTFWDEKQGCFLHGTKEQAHDYVTRYANMFAILFGYLSSEQTIRVRQSVLLNDDCRPITTPFMKFYELLAMGEAGIYSQMHQFLTSYWGGMLNLGCDTFWETYDPAQQGTEHYAMYGKPYGKSLCHAWGAGPIILFGRYYLGVQPTSPGYQTFLVEPHTNGLKNLRGSVPTPDGSILVEITPDGITVDNRSDGQGELRWEEQCTVIAPHTVSTIKSRLD